MGGLTPFGIAYYGVISNYKVNKKITFVSIALGILSIGFGVVQIKTILAMLVYLLISSLMPYSKSNIKNAARVSLSIFTLGTVIIFFNGFLLYDFILNVFESFLGGLLVLIFKNALEFFNYEDEIKTITNEQTISITILATLVITGLSNITVWNFEIRNVLTIAIILIFAFRSGVGIGAAIGIVSGLIISITTPMTPLLIGVYGFCGLMAGIFKDLGKIGAILGFLLANSIITIYMNGSTEILINIFDILGAAIIVFAIPSRIINQMNNYFIKPSLEHVEKKDRNNKIRDITIEKLHEIAESFQTVASTFDEIEEKNINVNRNDISTLFDEVADRVCKECSLNTICWHKDFYNTYQAMSNMLESMEQKGHLQMCDIPLYFKDKCIRIDVFIKNTNFMYEVFTLNKTWKKKINESKIIISQQVEGLSKIINKLAQEINVDIHFRPELEKEIYSILYINDIQVDEVLVMEDKNNKLEVMISHEPCNNKRMCYSIIGPIVSEVLGCRLINDRTNCGQDNKCIIKFKEEENYKIISGLAMISKEIVSGDNYKIIELNGKAIVAISDGMGSGETASIESMSALDLLETFIKNGFEKDIAIKLINSILILKSTEECFTTIDMCMVDLFTAEVEFAKIGASSTFIKRPNKIEVIKSTSLPVGILKNIDIELTKKELDDGDIVIMISDGVLESNRHSIKKEEWLIKELNDMNTTNPQEIANNILNVAQQNCEIQQDDMTVLVFKISEKI